MIIMTCSPPKLSSKLGCTKIICSSLPEVEGLIVLVVVVVVVLGFDVVVLVVEVGIAVLRIVSGRNVVRRGGLDGRGLLPVLEI